MGDYNLTSFELHFAGRILEAVRGAHGERNTLRVGAQFDAHFGRLKSEKERLALAPGNLNGKEPGGQFRRGRGQRPLDACRRDSGFRRHMHHDHQMINS
jgi:hypothetical protein